MKKRERKTKRKRCCSCDYVGTEGEVFGNGYFVCYLCAKRFKPHKIYGEDIV